MGSCGAVNPLGDYFGNGDGFSVYWHGLTEGAGLSQVLFKMRPNRCTAGFGLTCSKCSPGYTLVESTPGTNRKACAPFCDPSVCSECGSSNPRLCTGVCAPGYFK